MAEPTENKDNPPSHAAYDQVPYTSHPFPQTHPLLLQGIARLFGLTAPSPHRARILEIGCASGGNILAIGATFPESQCVGIDYSAGQIEMGCKNIAAIGCSNVELKHMSVMDVTRDFGTFDYIIAHGVLSWVSPEVQEKVLEVSSANLAPDGIAFISYNTLPGWNSVRSLRDMMLYHTRRFDDPAVKAEQGRALLKLVSDEMHVNNSLMTQIIDREIEILNMHADYYLLHDHLEEHNFAFYFSELMERAAKYGLQYVADTSLESMFSGNLTAATAEVLATSNDAVRTEQYMDFLTDRRFRNTLLCRQDIVLNRSVHSGIMREGWLAARFSYPEGFHEHDITSGQTMQFHSNGGMTLTSDDALVLAMLQVFMEKAPQAMRIAELTERVREKLDKIGRPFTEEDRNTLEEALSLHVLRYLFIGGISFTLHDLPFAAAVSEKPALSPLVRWQATQQDWVTNLLHQTLNITEFDKLLMPHVNGTHDIASLSRIVIPYFASREMLLHENDAPVENIEIIKERMPGVITNSLQHYAHLRLLPHVC